jgi:enamine deaminase RidA (YjgF/YER057c/UK114 family)
MSQTVTHGGTIYLSGQVADDTSADLVEQVRQVLAKIDALLVRAGSGRSKLLAANIWLASMSDFTEMNKVWEEWVPAGSAPARATVEAKLVSPAHRVEIAVIAAA